MPIENLLEREIKIYEEQLANPKDSFDGHLRVMIDVTKESINMYAKSINRCINSLKDRKEFFDGFMNELNKMD